MVTFVLALFGLALMGVAISLPAWRTRAYRNPLGTGPEAFIVDGKMVFALLWSIAAVLLVVAANLDGKATGGLVDNDVRRLGKTRVAVLEIGVDLDTEAGTVRIGGDPAIDDVVIEGLPTNLITITSDADGANIRLERTEGAGRHFALFVNRERMGEASDLPLRGVHGLTLVSSKEPPSAALSYGDLDELPRTDLTVRFGSPGIFIGFEDPEQLYAEPGNILPASADLLNQPRSGENVAPLRSVGGRLGPMLQENSLVLPQEGANETRIEGPGPQDTMPNEKVVLASSSFSVQLRVDPLNITSGLRGFAWPAMIITVLVSALLSFHRRREDAMVAALLGLAEILLCLRVLLAIEGGMVEETVRSRGALSDALLALPMGLLVLHIASAGRWRGAMAAVAAPVGMLLCAFVIAMGVLQTGTGELARSSLGVIIVCAVLAVIALGAHLCLSLYRKWREKRAEATQADPAPTDQGAADGEAGEVAEAAEPTDTKGWVLPIVWALSVAAIIVGLRYLLYALGYKEAINLGFRLSVSAFFIPLALIGAFPLLHLMLTDASRKMVVGCAFVVFAVLAVLVPHVALNEEARDAGLVLVLWFALFVTAMAVYTHMVRVSARTWFALALGALGGVLGLAQYLAGNKDVTSWLTPVLLIVVAVAVAVGARSFAGLKQRLEDFAPATAWTGMVFVFLALFTVTATPALQPDLTTPPQTKAEIASINTPIARLTGALAPERLGFYTSVAADFQRSTQEPLHAYGQTLWGNGYLNVPKIDVSVRKQQFSDFAIAVHFVSPFGRIALVGVILMLGALAIVAIRRFSARDSVHTLGTLFAMQFLATCIYISLSNLLLAPVTGRNFYLLAPQSNSDLLEGLLLLLVALVCASTPVRAKPGAARTEAPDLHLEPGRAL